MPRAPFEAAVRITRGGIVEITHLAAVAVCDAGGALVASLGDPDLVVYLRSSAKPFQAMAVVDSGAADRFGLTQPEIALVAGSHGGEDAHAAAAASILERAGIDPSALGCGMHPPFDRKTAERLLRNGEAPGVLRNNCSGKHAGMLAAAKAGGHPLDSYLEPDHPVQRANRETLSAMSGRPAGAIPIGVDGCGAPTFGVSLREAAAAFARLSAAMDGDDAAAPRVAAARRVAGAMRSHPEMVGGESLLDTALMRAVPGLISKVGADGVHAIGYVSPRGPVGVGLKIMDGDVGRGRTAVILGVLREIGALPDPSVLPESVRGPLTVRSLRGAVVGEVKADFRLGPLRRE